MTELRIIFMGTPEFAVSSLEILLKHKFNVVAVVTSPDKPKGRGQKVVQSPVKECAAKFNIPVLQPTNLKSPEFIAELKSFDAELQVVVAFRMLPQVVWSLPALGTFNLHASLLPDYRGAAPINWAIINGEKETGVTTFFLQQEIDTGNIIFQEKETIQLDDDAGSLYHRLMEKGAKLVLKTVQAMQDGNYTEHRQPEVKQPKLAPKIFKETCLIDWSQPTDVIVNFVRGLSPYPAAWTIIDGKAFKIFKVTPTEGGDDSTEAGVFETDNKTYLRFKTCDGWVSVNDLQAEGKRRMKIQDFFRGNKL